MSRKRKDWEAGATPARRDGVVEELAKEIYARMIAANARPGKSYAYVAEEAQAAAEAFYPPDEKTEAPQQQE